MDIKKAEKMVFVLSAASLVLPWFTYDSRIMGYCWGSEFFAAFLLPMVMVAYHVFGKKDVLSSRIVGPVGAAMNIAVLVYALGIWHERHNIASGFRFIDGLHTAVWGFWIAAVLFTFLMLVVVVSSFCPMARNGEDAA